jgi:hypothetical protein
MAGGFTRRHPVTLIAAGTMRWIALTFQLDTFVLNRDFMDGLPFSSPFYILCTALLIAVSS